MRSPKLSNRRRRTHDPTIRLAAGAHASSVKPAVGARNQPPVWLSEECDRRISGARHVEVAIGLNSSWDCQDSLFVLDDNQTALDDNLPFDSRNPEQHVIFPRRD